MGEYKKRGSIVIKRTIDFNLCIEYINENKVKLHLVGPGLLWFRKTAYFEVPWYIPWGKKYEQAVEDLCETMYEQQKLLDDKDKREAETMKKAIGKAGDLCN